MNAEESITRHEGYREIPYRDTLSYWTIGYGTNIHRMPVPSYCHTCGEVLDHLTNPEMHDVWFRRRFDEAERGAKVFAGNAWQTLSEARQNVLIELAYWIGFPRLSGFKRFRKALQEGRWVAAEGELLDSRLFQQVPARTRNLASRFLEG